MLGLESGPNIGESESIVCRIPHITLSIVGRYSGKFKRPLRMVIFSRYLVRVLVNMREEPYSRRDKISDNSVKAEKCHYLIM